MMTLALVGPSGCERKAPGVSAKRFTEGVLLDMQERAFDRLYDKLTRDRRRELSQEEYSRYNAAGFEKLDRLGGYFDDWQVDESASQIGDTEASVVVLTHATFAGASAPSEHRRRLVFKLVKEGDDWKFDSFTSAPIP
ncbi:MAG: hypothetical protein HY814_12905 [Candidatus Riflebacteria bacterium]|nr:hypothetical protein [Candidatus Riflebacteria bacterium]